MEEPEPMAVPPHEPLNQFQVAPVPNEPPTTLSVVEVPSQIVVVPLTPVGSVESWLTVTVNDAHIVVLQVPSART